MYAGPPTSSSSPDAHELVLERDQIDRLAAVGQPDHLLENPAVRIAEEIQGIEDFGGLVEGLVVDQDGAEDALLGFEVVRERPVHEVHHGPRRMALGPRRSLVSRSFEAMTREPTRASGLYPRA